MIELGFSLLLALGAGASAMACVRCLTKLKGKLRLGLGLVSGIATIGLLARAIGVVAGVAMPEWWNLTMSSAYALGMVIFWLRLEGHLKNGE